MTEDDLKTFLEENKVEIGNSIKGTIIKRMTEELRWSLNDTTSKIVNEFIEAEVVPAVKAHLMDNKGPIVENVISGIAKIGDKIQEVMVKQALENLQGYRGGEVIKSLFGAR